MSYKKNYKALMDDAPALVPPSNWLNDVADLQERMAIFLEDYQDTELGPNWLRLQASDDSTTLDTMRAILGVSKTSLEALVSKINQEAYAPIRKYIHYDQWSGVSCDPIKNMGMFDLLLNGYEKFHNSLCDNFIYQCRKDKLLESISEGTLHTLAMLHLKGTIASEKGNAREAIYHRLLDNLDVEHVRNGKLSEGVKTWDQLILNTIATEITVSDATGSDISNKLNAMLSDIQQHNCCFIFVGGGAGWQQRLSDARKIARSFDYVFAPSYEGAINYAKLVMKKLGRKTTSKKVRDALDLALNQGN